MKEQLSLAFVIARYTLRELVKSRLLAISTVVSFLIVTISIVVAEFTYGAKTRVALDFGFGMAALSSVGISIFMGNGLIFKEIESRTLYMVLARPITRISFLQGRSLGLMIFLAMNTIIMILPSLGLYTMLGGKIDGLFFWAAFFIFLESIIVMNVCILFSLISSQAFAAVFSLGVYIGGHTLSSEAFQTFLTRKPEYRFIDTFFSFFVPNLSGMNIKEHLLYKYQLSGAYLSEVTFHGFIYLLAILLISNIIFSKKNLN